MRIIAVTTVAYVLVFHWAAYARRHPHSLVARLWRHM